MKGYEVPNFDPLIVARSHYREIPHQIEIFVYSSLFFGGFLDKVSPLSLVFNHYKTSPRQVFSSLNHIEMFSITSKHTCSHLTVYVIYRNGLLGST